MNKTKVTNKGIHLRNNLKNRPKEQAKETIKRKTQKRNKLERDFEI